MPVALRCRDCRLLNSRWKVAPETTITAPMALNQVMRLKTTPRVPYSLRPEMIAEAGRLAFLGRCAADAALLDGLDQALGAPRRPDVCPYDNDGGLGTYAIQDLPQDALTGNLPYPCHALPRARWLSDLDLPAEVAGWLRCPQWTLTSGGSR